MEREIWVWLVLTGNVIKLAILKCITKRLKFDVMNQFTNGNFHDYLLNITKFNENSLQIMWGRFNLRPTSSEEVNFRAGLKFWTRPNWSQKWVQAHFEARQGQVLEYATIYRSFEYKGILFLKYYTYFAPFASFFVPRHTVLRFWY